MAFLLATDTLIEAPVTNDMSLEDSSKGAEAAVTSEGRRKWFLSYTH